MFEFWKPRQFGCMVRLWAKIIGDFLVLITWWALPWISNSGGIHAPDLASRASGYFMWGLIGIGATILFTQSWRKKLANERTSHPKGDAQPNSTTQK